MANDGADEHLVFVIHAIIPYCYDFNTILALPAGFRYRNRFDELWVDPALHNAADQMNTKDVLLVMRDKDRNRLVPVRWARIALSERVGRVFYFEYTLGDLIKYSADQGVREAEIADYTHKFAQLHDHLPGEVGKPLTTPGVFKSTAGRGFPTAPADELTEWGNTTFAVTTADIYKQVEFLNVIGLVDLEGKRCAVRDESFVVKRNTVYQLRVFQTIPVQDELIGLRPHDIRISMFSEHFSKLRDTQRAVGKYDMLNFILKTANLPPNERSAIEIPHVPHHRKGGFAPNALYLPVVVSGRTVAGVLLYCLGVAVSLLAIFDPKLSHLNVDNVRNIGTVVFVLLISGWTRTSSALFPILPWVKGN